MNLSRLLLAVPHDAPSISGWGEGFVPRKTGKTVRDVAVAAIAADIVGSLPFAVMIRGQLPRTFVDYNRAPSEAVEDPRLKPYYDSYHAEIEALLTPDSLLVDLHGFASGETDGRECDLLISSCGSLAARSLSDSLSCLGYRVAYDDGSSNQAASIMTAGYTTRRYAEKGFHTVQIEISDKFRTTETRELGKKLSRDLAQVFEAYCFLKPEIACKISSGTVKTTVFD